MAKKAKKKVKAPKKGFGLFGKAARGLASRQRRLEAAMSGQTETIRRR